MDETTEYVLDFSVPQGPTGPTGPNPPLCYVEYYDTNTASRNFLIEKSKILNSNGEFSIENNTTVIVNPGTYEITFCGQVEVSGDFQLIIMTAVYEDLGNSYTQLIGNLVVALPPGIKFTNFSQTQFITFDKSKKLIVYISNNNSVTATAKLCTLILKKVETD